jgi:hypothetical protein
VCTVSRPKQLCGRAGVGCAGKLYIGAARPRSPLPLPPCRSPWSAAPARRTRDPMIMAGRTVCLLLLLLTGGVTPRSTRGTDHSLETLAQRHRQHRHRSGSSQGLQSCQQILFFFFKYVVHICCANMLCKYVVQICCENMSCKYVVGGISHWIERISIYHSITFS